MNAQDILDLLDGSPFPYKKKIRVEDQDYQDKAELKAIRWGTYLNGPVYALLLLNDRAPEIRYYYKLTGQGKPVPIKKVDALVDVELEVPFCYLKGGTGYSADQANLQSAFLKACYLVLDLTSGQSISLPESNVKRIQSALQTLRARLPHNNQSVQRSPAIEQEKSRHSTNVAPVAKMISTNNKTPTPGPSTHNGLRKQPTDTSTDRSRVSSPNYTNRRHSAPVHSPTRSTDVAEVERTPRRPRVTCSPGRALDSRKELLDSYIHTRKSRKDLKSELFTLGKEVETSQAALDNLKNLVATKEKDIAELKRKGDDISTERVRSRKKMDGIIDQMTPREAFKLCKRIEKRKNGLNA